MTVDVDFATGTTTEDADFVTAAQAALQAVADATAGVSFDGTTLTFDDTLRRHHVELQRDRGRR